MYLLIIQLLKAWLSCEEGDFEQAQKLCERSLKITEKVKRLELVQNHHPLTFDLRCLVLGTLKQFLS